MNRILQEDIEAFSVPQELEELLEGKIIAVTGATGLIGSLIV